MRVNVTIDRLVLDGIDVDAHDRPRLHAAIASHLADLLARDGVSPELAAGGAVPSVRAPELSIAANASPRRLGAAIAESIHGGIGGPRR